MSFTRYLVTAILAGLVLGGCSCTGPEGTLQKQGFKEIDIGMPPVFGCGEGDSRVRSRNFTAKNAQGQQVSGTVCCGLIFKGCTVRF